jgi:hypothetical protein
MRRLLLLALLAPGCGGPERQPPAPDRAQLVVTVKALPRKGLNRGSGGGYEGESGPSGRQWARVDYSGMEDIAVMVCGSHLGEGGPAPRAVRLEVDSDGADHRLLLMGPRGHTTLTIANATKEARTLFAVGGTGDGFDVTVKAGAESEVTISDPGVYEVSCDEDPRVAVTIVVAPTTWAALVESGDEAFFDGLRPGAADVRVLAPRLPAASKAVTLTAGRRDEVTVEVSVNSLGTAK